MVVPAKTCCRDILRKKVDTIDLLAVDVSSKMRKLGSVRKYHRFSGEGFTDGVRPSGKCALAQTQKAEVAQRDSI